MQLFDRPFRFFHSKKIAKVNPTAESRIKEPDEIKVFVYDYHSEEITEQEAHTVEECYKYLNSEKVSWINIDGLRKTDIENVCAHFGIHHLIMDDILRVIAPKWTKSMVFCLHSPACFISMKAMALLTPNK